jgi:23S rRNA (guanosine2251-2'-O)-methyltransferase
VERGRRRTEAGGPGGEQVEGRRAVLELLRAGRRPVRSVWLARDLDPDPVLDEIISRAGSALRLVPAEQVLAASRSDAPQGVVARAEPLPSARLDALLATPDAFLVALDSITDPRNLGAVLRAAETAGVHGVVVPRHRSARLTPAAMKAAAGAAEYVPVAVVSGIPAALDRARRADVWTVGLDAAAGRAVDDLPLASERLVLVLGAEGEGLAALTRRRCDALARIPMEGRIESLNVASAAAVACHAVARQRRLARGGQ